MDALHLTHTTPPTAHRRPPPTAHRPRLHPRRQRSGQSGCTGSDISPSPPAERNPWADVSAPATDSDSLSPDSKDQSPSFSNQSPPQLDSLRSSAESSTPRGVKVEVPPTPPGGAPFSQ